MDGPGSIGRGGWGGPGCGGVPRLNLYYLWMIYELIVNLPISPGLAGSGWPGWGWTGIAGLFGTKLGCVSPLMGGGGWLGSVRAETRTNIY